MVKGTDCAPEVLGSAARAAHTVQALCCQTLAVMHFYTSDSTKPAKLEGALEGLPAPQLQMLPKPPQSSAFSSAETCPWNCQVTEPEKSLVSCTAERAREVRRKQSVVTPFAILLTDTCSVSILHSPISLCSLCVPGANQPIHFTVAIAKPLVLLSRTLMFNSFNLEICCINCYLFAHVSINCL